MHVMTAWIGPHADRDRPNPIDLGTPGEMEAAERGCDPANKKPRPQGRGSPINLR
jgi:hypothetical protein